MRRPGLFCVTIVLLFLLCCLLLSAQDKDDIDLSGTKVDKKKVDAAVRRAVEYLKPLQRPDGGWVCKPRSPAYENEFPGGTTALVLFALLKSELVDRDDPIIKKGFAFCTNVPASLRHDKQKQGFEQKTYSVSMLILALEAKYRTEKEPDTKKKKKKKKKGTFVPMDDKAKQEFAKANQRDRALMRALLNWLLTHQEANIWRYPGAAQDDNNEDCSNTQYAMLALNTCRRVGYKIPAGVWEKVASYFIKYKDTSGLEVEWFPVPGADFAVEELKGLELEKLEQMKEQHKSEETETKSGTVTIGNPYEKYGVKKSQMQARGWSYINECKTKVQPIEKAVWEGTTGSMTTSGVAALMICKVGLEGKKGWKKYEKKVNKGIRDGCAWLAHNFTVKKNPHHRGGLFQFYYLYGLERVGVLTLTHKFGKHNWYEEGANGLLRWQDRNGSWLNHGGDVQAILVNTCFAILFLKKATTPIVDLGPIYTGGELTKEHRKKDK